MEEPRFPLSLQTDLSSGCTACEVCRNQASCDAFKLRKEMSDDTPGLPVECSLPHRCSNTVGRQAHCSGCACLPFLVAVVGCTCDSRCVMSLHGPECVVNLLDTNARRAGMNGVHMVTYGQ